MCTVTIFYKGNNDFVLTSNRDEAPNRSAIAPEFYTINTIELLLPKDEKSGGSWIGASTKKRVVCLLNGGFEIHKRKLKYRQSRGVVVRDLLVADTITNAMALYDYSDIEPFTIVIADWDDGLQFFELVWTGEKASVSVLPLTNHIWSSSTLYDEEKKQTRREWFKAFKSKNELSAETLMKFHTTAGQGNLDYGVVMDRGFVKTTSITQIEKTNDHVAMRFKSVDTEKTTIKSLNLAPITNE